MKSATLRLCLLRLEERAVPAIVTWDGGSATNALWSDAANWVGDAVPQPGDDLVFPLGANRLANNHDFATGTVFGSIRLTGASYLIDGKGCQHVAG